MVEMGLTTVRTAGGNVSGILTAERTGALYAGRVPPSPHLHRACLRIGGARACRLTVSLLSFLPLFGNLFDFLLRLLQSLDPPATDRYGDRTTEEYASKKK